jgi:hypothetical protein
MFGSYELICGVGWGLRKVLGLRASVF